MKNIFELVMSNSSNSSNSDPSSPDCSNMGECISPGGNCTKCPNKCCWKGNAWKGCRLVGTGTSYTHKCDYPPTPSPPPPVPTCPPNDPGQQCDPVTNCNTWATKANKNCNEIIPTSESELDKCNKFYDKDTGFLCHDQGIGLPCTCGPQKCAQCVDG